MTVHVANFTVSGELPTRLGSGAVITAPYQAFRAADGYIVIAAGNGSLFKKLAEELGHIEWVDDPRFTTNSNRLEYKNVLATLIEETLKDQMVTNLVSRLEKAGVPCAPILNVGETIASAQAQALSIIRQNAGDNAQFVGLPVSFDGVRPTRYQEPAKLGEHNEEIFGKWESK